MTTSDYDRLRARQQVTKSDYDRLRARLQVITSQRIITSQTMIKMLQLGVKRIFPALKVIQTVSIYKISDI